MMLAEGPVRIVLSYKEPMKDVLWMRPFLGKDGYDLLYYGANGWTRWCLCGADSGPVTDEKDVPVWECGEEEETAGKGPENAKKEEDTERQFTDTIPCGCNRQ